MIQKVMKYTHGGNTPCTSNKTIDKMNNLW